MPEQTLDKRQIVSGKNNISRLLSEGKWITGSCMKFCWRVSDGPCTRIMVSVPKRLFKRAVKRNLLKRRIRESYRTCKAMLPEGMSFDILFAYNCPEVKDSAYIKECVQAGLSTIKAKADVSAAKDTEKCV